MLIQGKIEEIPVVTLFYFVYYFQLDVDLKILFQNEIHVITFSKGFPVKYSANEIKIKFGQFLYNEGIISIDYVELFNSKKGFSLIKREGLRHITKDHLNFLYKEYIKCSFLKAFELTGGTFSFEENYTSEINPIVSPIYLIALGMKQLPINFLKDFYSRIRYYRIIHDNNYSFLKHLCDIFGLESKLLDTLEKNNRVLDFIPLFDENIEYARFFYFAFHCHLIKFEEMDNPFDALNDQIDYSFWDKSVFKAINPDHVQQALKFKALGEESLKQNDLIDAAESYHNAIKLNIFDNRLQMDLSLAQFLAGRLSDAEKSVQISILNDSTDPKVFFHYGNILKEKNEYNLAIIYFKKALKLQPTFLQANDAIFELQQLFNSSEYKLEPVKKSKYTLLGILFFLNLCLTISYFAPSIRKNPVTDKLPHVNYYQLSTPFIIIVFDAAYEKLEEKEKENTRELIIFKLANYKGKLLIFMNHFGEVLFRYQL